jgi:hypothetical protein
MFEISDFYKDYFNIKKIKINILIHFKIFIPFKKFDILFKVKSISISAIKAGTNFVVFKHPINGKE